MDPRIVFIADMRSYGMNHYISKCDALGITTYRDFKAWYDDHFDAHISDEDDDELVDQIMANHLQSNLSDDISVSSGTESESDYPYDSIYTQESGTDEEDTDV
jgi:hypothetical protein